MDNLPIELVRRRHQEPLDSAYAAGFLDGEGTVVIIRFRDPRKRFRYRVAVIVPNTVIVPLEWLCARWGGKVYNFRPPGVGHRSQSWQWQINTRADQVAFLEDVRPYVKIKGPAIDNCLAFLRLSAARGKRRLTETSLAEQEIHYRVHRKIQDDHRPAPAHLRVIGA